MKKRAIHRKEGGILGARAAKLRYLRSQRRPGYNLPTKRQVFTQGAIFVPQHPYMAKRSFEPVSERDKKKITKEGLQKALRIYSFIWPYRFRFLLGLVFLAFSSLTVMTFPYVTGKLVDSATGNLVGYDRDTIALGLVGILLVQGVFSFLRVQIFSQVSERAMRDIRLALYTQILSLPIPFFEQRRVGELNSRLTADVQQLQDVLSFTLAEFFRQLVTLVIGIVVIFTTSTELTLVMLSSFPLMIIGAIVFGRYIRKLSKKAQDELAAANTVVEETLQAIHTVKSFTSEFFEVARYRKGLNEVVGNALKAARFRGVFISFIIFAIFGGIVLVLWYGLGLVADKSITIGELVSFIVYTTFIGGAVGGMGDLYGQIQKTVGASERLVEILDESPELSVKDLGQQARFTGEVVFEGVRFAYPSRPDMPVLQGLDLYIPAGQKVALVGHSGAGKSTVGHLLQGFYPVGAGAIRIDGLDTGTLELGQLRANIGVVPQEVLLFGGTIAENIAYGKPGASEAEIRHAAEQANAWEFIERFPEGLQTVVGERGIKLSGGQRQRIAIARAILKDPAILILDEATSSLDAESEHLVQQALDVLMQGRTTLIIAHRLATIRKVDRIFVLGEGRVLESGSHTELAERGEGLYNNLVKLQLEVE